MEWTHQDVSLHLWTKSTFLYMKHPTNAVFVVGLHFGDMPKETYIFIMEHVRYWDDHRTLQHYRHAAERKGRQSDLVDGWNSHAHFWKVMLVLTSVRVFKFSKCFFPAAGGATAFFLLGNSALHCPRAACLGLSAVHRDTPTQCWAAVLPCWAQGLFTSSEFRTPRRCCSPPCQG